MRRLAKTIAAMMIMTATVFAVGCTPENNDSDVRVTTYTPQDITSMSAVCGGDVIVTQGLSINKIGVCWSTDRNPTADDDHLCTTNWSEPFVCTLTGLEHNTKYHVRAYALRGLEYYYGEDKSFTTVKNVDGSYHGHDYVDLGLPSGLLWATCNVGADNPEDYGDYFAWGETDSKTIYNWDTYKYSNANGKLTKYCNNSMFGIVDYLLYLQPADNAATVNWGAGWNTPTDSNWKELCENTTVTWTTKNGVTGYLFAANSGKSLFLPAAGYRNESSLYDDGSKAYYWTNMRYEDTDYPNRAHCFDYYSPHHLTSHNRCFGQSVRPVRSAE